MKRFSIAFITNIDQSNFSGGWSGMNFHVFKQLSKHFQVTYLQVDPPYRTIERYFSKLFRTLGLQGIYPAYSKYRLELISSLVNKQIQNDADCVFYHGSTPWLKVKQTKPYFCYLDASFYTYINHYHNINEFDEQQLAQLFLMEAEFLQNAKGVFFSSGFAKGEAIKAYKIKSENLHVIGLGVDDPIEIESQKVEEQYFLFVGLDFLGKGGTETVEAFLEVRRKLPAIKLKLIGECPINFQNRENEGIEYLGHFNKSDTTQAKKLKEIFAHAIALILPTKKDMTPLVIIEAAFYGVPSISVNNFGIPELILHNKTGILLNPSDNIVSQLILHMYELAANQELRNKLGIAAKEFSISTFSWESIGCQMHDTINKILDV